MQLSLLTCLFGLTTFALADYTMYCNAGTAGDGSCEKEGYYTFCCTDTKQGEYVNKKDVKQWPNSLSPEGKDKCGANWEGGIWCAK